MQPSPLREGLSNGVPCASPLLAALGKTFSATGHGPPPTMSATSLPPLSRPLVFAIVDGVVATSATSRRGIPPLHVLLLV